MLQEARMMGRHMNTPFFEPLGSCSCATTHRLCCFRQHQIETLLPYMTRFQMRQATWLMPNQADNMAGHISNHRD